MIWLCLLCKIWCHCVQQCAVLQQFVMCDIAIGVVESNPGLQGPWHGLHEDVALDEGLAHVCLGWSWMGLRWEWSPTTDIHRGEWCHARSGSLWIGWCSCRGSETQRCNPQRSCRCSLACCTSFSLCGGTEADILQEAQLGEAEWCARSEME